jgi:hypothetical protein
LAAATKGSTIFVPKGSVHFADTLHLRRSVILHGAGMLWQTTLHFPEKKSLVIDLVTDNPSRDNSNSETIVRDLAVNSEKPWTSGDPPTVNTETWTEPSTGTPGIRMNVYSTLENVLVQGFSGTGIEINGDGVTGHANFWRIHNCQVFECGGHGLYVQGGDANGGLCLGLKVGTVGGCGIFDSSAGGGTYVGCYVEIAQGGGYPYHNAQPQPNADDAGNTSTFFGCYSECEKPARLLAGATYISGSLMENFTPDSQALAALGAGQVWPFQVHVPNPNPQGSSVRTFVGVDTEKPFGWTTAGYEDNIHWELRWSPEERVWALEAANSVRAAYFTTRHGALANQLEHPRKFGLQGFPSLLLGPAADAAQPNIRIDVASNPPVPSETDQWGDRVFNTSPVAGDPARNCAGWIFAQNEDGQTFAWRPFGVIV